VSANLWLALADTVLVVHAAFVAFVVVGFLLIPVGNQRGWCFVDGYGFRVLHLAAIGVVVVESWFGYECPLTTLENWLRLEAGVSTYRTSFIEHWVGRLIFYDAPEALFTLIYTAFAAMVVATWWFYPPRPRS
jgi:hypothetical protein